MHRRFAKWAEQKRRDLDALGVSTEEICLAEGGTKPAARVDHRSSCCMGRVTVWESGELEAEVLDLRSGEIFLAIHHDLASEPDFDATLQCYLDGIAVPKQR